MHRPVAREYFIAQCHRESLKSYIHGVTVLSYRVPLGFVFLTVLMSIVDAIITLLTELANSRASTM
jgi:hypothetical protein